MKKTLNVRSPLISCALVGFVALGLLPTSGQMHQLSAQANLPGACTSFCLPNGDHCVFGTNFDNTLEMGLLFVNKRHVSKTTWDPNPAGEVARWVSRYGSVTVNFIGYQMAWAGMNEAGLMISTMSLNETEGPSPDERFYFESQYWMQYQLDNHSTVDQVIASDAEMRVPQSQADHYLVCDRTGECAVLEFLEGKLVAYRGEALPVKALTNSTYEISLLAMEEIRQGGGEGYGNSIQRFVTAAERLSAFEVSDAQEAVEHAFDLLAAVSREDTVWSFVYDPANLRLYFRTNKIPQVRALDFSQLDFSCETPVQMMDVHADVSGDISDDLMAYDHNVSLKHATGFFSAYEGANMSPILVEILLRGLESFPCQEGESAMSSGLVRHHPLFPPTIGWAGLAAVHRLWPVWIGLLALSLAILLWRMARDKQLTTGKRLLWVVVTIIFGPFGLLAYLIVRRRNLRVAAA